jgi:hypothetical protein
MRWTWIGIMLWSMSLAASSQAQVHIDFDDLSAPCSAASAMPLQYEYLADGIEFLLDGNNGAAVLHECSGLGVPGYSPPNFAVIDPQALLANGGVPDRLFFIPTGSVPSRVRVWMGGTPGTTVQLACGICPWAIPGCTVSTEATLGSAMQALEVSTTQSFPMGCEITPISGTGQWIIDDLELDFQQPTAPIPMLSGSGLVAFIGLIVLIGVVLIRLSQRQ